MSFKSNIEYWNELKENGWLYEYIKDGEPESIIDQLIGIGYPIILIIFISFCFFFYPKLPENKKRYKTFITSVSIAGIVGWIWNQWMVYSDPAFPAWLYPPWAMTNIEFINSLEDWIFYPICTAAFYIVYRYIDVKDIKENRSLTINIIIFFYFFIILFYILFTALCGQTVALLFATPGLLMFVYSRDELNVKKFIYFLPVSILVDAIWDWTAVSWVHETEGMAWASQWVFVSFNEAGEHIQSSVFLDYVKYPWAWILNAPIEITPWLGLTGAIFNFSLFAAIDKFFDKKGIDQ